MFQWIKKTDLLGPLKIGSPSSYVPAISLLVRGWIVFVFLEDDHATQVLNRLWRVGKGSLVLNRWHVNFDPARERVKKRYL